MQKRRISVGPERCKILLEALSRYSPALGEDDFYAWLTYELQHIQSVYDLGLPDDTLDEAGEIFAAGTGEGGTPSYREFKRDGVVYTQFPDGKVYGNGPLATARL